MESCPQPKKNGSSYSDFYFGHCVVLLFDGYTYSSDLYRCTTGGYVEIKGATVIHTTGKAVVIVPSVLDLRTEGLEKCHRCGDHPPQELIVAFGTVPIDEDSRVVRKDVVGNIQGVQVLGGPNGPNVEDSFPFVPFIVPGQAKSLFKNIHGKSPDVVVCR